MAYWVSENILNIFDEGIPLGNISEIATGISTGNNDLYLRTWTEVSNIKLALYMSKMENIDLDKTPWSYNKGGEARKWYGNNDYVVKWSEQKIFIEQDLYSVIYI